MTILYGSETGNSTALARQLEGQLKAAGVNATAADMAKYKGRGLKDEQDVLVVVSTYGEGDPPQPAVPFFEFVEGARAPKMEGVRFGVLALGDSTYEFYCEAGKRIDKRFEELGATRLFDRVDCDIDYDEPAASWAAQVVAKLKEEAAAAAPAGQPAPAASPFPTAASSYDKRNPFAATVLESIKITGRASSKETRHVEIDLDGSGLTYEPGDALGIVSTNEPHRVEELLEVTGLSADAPITLKGDTVRLASALESHFEITQAAPRFIEQWAMLSGSAELGALMDDDRRQDRADFLYGHHVIDIVRQYPLGGVTPEDFVAGLRPLQPRLYSIASSQKAVDSEVHLTINPVRYDLHGIGRNGVASAHICDRIAPGDQLPVYVQANAHFKLPTDDSRPIIMVGPGTGVAPFRAFLQEREARGAEGRSWLFFGERNFRSDFLYQIEWQDWLANGVLTDLDVAFSRDAGAKVYVQHRMLEKAQQLYAWLEEGAHFYVCGDERMAKDVEAALETIVADQRGCSAEDAHAYVRDLTAQERYQRDVY
ncbi:assimilatory sulfite reductase (NADPH) flavoprotein subunit [Sphingomonas piscis]|uniref:assimilatory sulfite reductase (NADPH) n=1 Tax=Sphingomonas piscis TaxID=2714943 RepID=A0A6G7YNH6_9SPHN|nr:assimilatory sulfite reductase (NADPH) flavoprotein subunit [Sphingomonas piscis]